MTTRPQRPTGKPCTTSFWARTFESARLSGGWTRVGRFYTRKTAAQIASDITCAHRRPPGCRRLKGITDGEVWEARWAPALDGPPGDHRIEIRLVETTGRSTTVTELAPGPADPAYTETSRSAGSAGVHAA